MLKFKISLLRKLVNIERTLQKKSRFFLIRYEFLNIEGFALFGMLVVVSNKRERLFFVFLPAAIGVRSSNDRRC